MASEANFIIFFTLTCRTVKILLVIVNFFLFYSTGRKPSICVCRQKREATVFLTLLVRTRWLLSGGGTRAFQEVKGVGVRCCGIRGRWGEGMKLSGGGGVKG